MTVTREPQQPLSLVDHLRTTLYNLKAQHTRVQDAIDGYRSVATLDDEYRDLLTSCERTAEQLEQQITAQEQTIAILSVLTHPDFFQLEDFGRPVDLCNGGRAYLSLQRMTSNTKRTYVGETVLDALLKAHAALRPQEGAASGKESTDADTV